MKYLIILLLLYGCKDFKSTRYCGKVVEKYRLSLSNGDVYHVVFHSDSLNRNIDVSVSMNTYANTNTNVCFDLIPFETQ